MPPDPDTSVNPDDIEDDPDAPEDKPKTFTQQQVNRLMAREKREGKDVGLREAMELLGADSLDEAKELLEAARERDSKAEDDASKRLRKVEERERKTAERERKATVKENRADVLAALISEKMDAEKAALAVSMVKVDLTVEDLSEDEILEAVETLKEKMPELFGEPEVEETEKEWRPIGSPDSTARGGQRRRPQPQTAKDRAAAVLAKRHPEFAKKT